IEREGRALAQLGFDRHGPAELLGEAEHLAEAEPGALAKALGREEGLEHPLHGLGRHAAAVVRYLQGDMLASQAIGLALEHLIRGAEPELSTALHRVAGVEGEVEQRELERAGVGVDAPELI